MVSTITKKEYMEMYQVIGAAMEVHSEVGRGLEEPVYQEMLALEMKNRNIPFEREKLLEIFYKGTKLEKNYFADFFSNDIVIELKAVTELCNAHRAQLFNYTRIAKKRRCILINFGEKNLHSERYVYQDEDDDFALLKEDNLSLYVRG